MANTYVDYTGNGSTTDFNFSFPYIKTAHVAVEVNEGQGAGGTNQWVRKTLTTDYSVQTSPNTFVRFVTAPSSNVKVRVLRDSEANEGIVDFANGSVLTETELDNSYQHNRYLAQEAEEGATGGALTKRGTGHYNADGLKLENIADPDSDDDAVNKGYADTRYVDAAGDSMSGNLDMGANKVTSSATPSSGNDLTNKTYTDATFVDAAGDSMSGDLNMGGNDVVSTNSVQGLATPAADTHAANKKYVDDNDALQVTKSGDSMSGELNMGSNKITNVTDPSANQEAATKKYVDDTITTSFATGSPPPGNEIGTDAIEDDAVTYAKLQNVAANNVLLGNDNGAGVDAQELTATEARTLLNVEDGAEENVQSDWNEADTNSDAFIQNKPTIPTNNNQLTNGANYITDADVASNSAVAANTAKISYTDAAAVALNTAKVTNATHTGDATGATALTLATVNSNVGSFTNADITVNAKGLITAAASGSGVSKYNSGWQTSFGGTTVANAASITVTHNLGTTDVTVAVYVNSSASDSNAQLVPIASASSAGHTGYSITSLSSNSFTLQLANGYPDLATTGLCSTTNYTGLFIKVVTIG
jgi:hypothetical protein